MASETSAGRRRVVSIGNPHRGLWRVLAAGAIRDRADRLVPLIEAIPRDRPVPPLCIAAKPVTARWGQCMCCGAEMDEHRGGQCELCNEALVIALRRAGRMRGVEPAESGTR